MTKRDTPIPWDRYSPDQVETLISGLLLRLHPGARRMDGAGGDDGVDVLVPVDGGIHVFEIKSYTSRLTDSQKRAIAKSLRTAAGHPEMRAWTLVVPLDHSPAELRWMNETLAKLADVPVDWIGRARLEVELGRHPDLVRSFAPGAVEHRAFEMLNEYDRTEAIPARTVGELVDKAFRLGEQAAVVDPFYNLDIGIRSGSVVIMASPKDEQAVPLTGTFKLAAPEGTPESEMIEAFMNFGRPVELEADSIAGIEIDLPPSMQDLVSPEMFVKHLTIGPAPDAPPTSQPVRFDAVDDANRVLGSLSAVFTDISRGPRGGLYFAGHDRSGFLRLTMTVLPDTIAGQFDVISQFTDGLLPADVIPGLRFLDAMRRAVEVRVTADGVTTPCRIPQARDLLAGMEDALRFAEALDRIGQAVGVVIDLPQRWTAEDAVNVAFYDTLLRDGTATYLPPGYLPLSVPTEKARELLAQGLEPRLSMTGEQGDRVPTLLGHELPLPHRLAFETTDLLVANAPELAHLVAADPPPDTVDIELVADHQTRTTFRFIEDV